MARYIRRSRSTAQLREQLMRQLEREGEKLLASMLTDFTKNLNTEVENVLKSRLQGSEGNYNTPAVANLLATGARYLFSRPRTSSSTRDSDRSRAMADQFKLSQSQAAAEAGQQLARAEKNW